MKKYIQFILAVAILVISYDALSQEKVFDLKDKYYNCGNKNFRVKFKLLKNNEQFIPNFIIEPITAVEGSGYFPYGSTMYGLILDNINSSCKIIFYNNLKIDSISGIETYDIVQSFEVIKLDTLPIPTITQVGNKLVSNIEGPHRWYRGLPSDNIFEDTPNNEYIPKMQGVYYGAMLNPDYECVSAESKGLNYIINSVEEDNFIPSNKYNINENTITFFEVGEITRDIELDSVELYNIFGEKIELTLSNISENNNSISMVFDSQFSNLPNGMYLILLRDSNNFQKFTFIK